MARVVDQMLVEVGVDVDNEFILGCKFYPSPDTEQMLDPFHTGGPYRRHSFISLYLSAGEQSSQLRTTIQSTAGDDSWFGYDLYSVLSLAG